MNWNWNRCIGKFHLHIFAANSQTHEFALFLSHNFPWGCSYYMLPTSLVLSQVHRGHCSVLSHCFTSAVALIISSDDLHVHFFLLLIQSAINFIQPNFILYFSVLEFLFVYLKNISTIFRPIFYPSFLSKFPLYYYRNFEAVY